MTTTTTTTTRTTTRTLQQHNDDRHHSIFTRPSSRCNHRRRHHHHLRAERLVTWLAVAVVALAGMTKVQAFLPSAPSPLPLSRQRLRYSAVAPLRQQQQHRRHRTTSVWWGLNAHESSSASLFDLKQQRPGESSLDYMKRLGQAAAQASTSPVGVKTTSNRADEAADSDQQQQPPTKKGYQRVEEWEQEQQELAQQSSSWEERVQFEGQRHGNRLAQNEILRRNLKLW